MLAHWLSSAPVPADANVRNRTRFISKKTFGELMSMSVLWHPGAILTINVLSQRKSSVRTTIIKRSHHFSVHSDLDRNVLICQPRHNRLNLLVTYFSASYTSTGAVNSNAGPRESVVLVAQLQNGRVSTRCVSHFRHRRRIQKRLG